MSMFVHSRSEIKSMVVSALDEPYIVTTKSTLFSAANHLAHRSSSLCIRPAPLP